MCILFIFLEHFLKFLTFFFFFKRPEILWNCPIDNIVLRIGSFWTIFAFEEIPSERYKLIWVYETDIHTPTRYRMFKVFDSIIYFEGERPRSIWYPVRASSRFSRNAIAFVDNETVCAVAKYYDGSFYIDVNTSEFENFLKIPNVYYKQLTEKRFCITYWLRAYPEYKLPGDFYKFDCIFNLHDPMFTQYRCRIRHNLMVTEYKYACFLDEQVPFIKNTCGDYAGLFAAISAIIVVSFPFLAWNYSLI
jgi:hypothetical protein